MTEIIYDDPEIWERYKVWLLGKAGFRYEKGPYGYDKLIDFLHHTRYTYVIETDPDRLATGITTLWDSPGGLEYRKIYSELTTPDLRFPNYFEFKVGVRIKDTSRIPTSVLEELVYLSVTCEERLMYDLQAEGPEKDDYRYYGGRYRPGAIRVDRGPRLFELILENLKLLRYNDEYFNEELVDFLVQRWMKREYKPNGEGGIMPMYGTDRDQRYVPHSSQIAEYRMHYTDGQSWLNIGYH